MVKYPERVVENDLILSENAFDWFKKYQRGSFERRDRDFELVTGLGVSPVEYFGQSQYHNSFSYIRHL